MSDILCIAMGNSLVHLRCIGLGKLDGTIAELLYSASIDMKSTLHFGLNTVVNTIGIFTVPFSLLVLFSINLFHTLYLSTYEPLLSKLPQSNSFARRALPKSFPQTSSPSGPCLATCMRFTFTRLLSVWISFFSKPFHRFPLPQPLPLKMAETETKPVTMVPTHEQETGNLLACLKRRVPLVGHRE